MSIAVDTEERTSRSNIYSIFGKLMCRQISSNTDGEILLKKSGLSAFWDKFKDNLTPYWYNKGYQNENSSYNPEYACIKICEAIESDEDSLLRFLNSILVGIHDIEEKQFRQLSNYLNVIGYELSMTVEVDDEYDIETKNYSLIPSADGIQQRNTDITFLHYMLLSHHTDLVVLYNEALANFGAGQYVSCIENCRSLFENFFKKLDTASSNYVKGILVATGEIIDDHGVELTSINKIYNYWLDNKKGANRFRLFQTIYSVMSGLGTHHEDAASREDALLLLRYVEDCLLWCFRKGINC